MLNQKPIVSYSSTNSSQIFKIAIFIFDMVWSNRAPILVAALLCWSVAEHSSRSSLVAAAAPGLRSTAAEFTLSSRRAPS